MYCGMHSRVTKQELIMPVELRIVCGGVRIWLIIEQPESYVMNFQCVLLPVLGLF